MKNEETLAILGFRIPIFNVYIGLGCWRHEGEPASVSFNQEKILNWRKWVVAFWHTHPNMINFPSSTDIPTMYAWCNTLGKSLFCLIEGIDGEFSDPMFDFYPTMISNHLFTTYPMDNIEDEKKYIGHAYRFGNFFIWRNDVEFNYI